MGYTLSGCCCETPCLPDRIVAEFFKLRPDPVFYVAFSGCTDPTGSFKLSVGGLVTSSIPIPFVDTDVQTAMESILDPSQFIVISPSTAPSTSLQIVLRGDYKSTECPSIEVVDFDMECAPWEGGNTPDDPTIEIIETNTCTSDQSGAADGPYELVMVDLDSAQAEIIRAQWKLVDDPPDYEGDCDSPQVTVTLDHSCIISSNMTDLFSGSTDISTSSSEPCCIPGSSDDPIRIDGIGNAPYTPEDSYCLIRSA